jgi:hypothetical protein
MQTNSWKFWAVSSVLFFAPLAQASFCERTMEQVKVDFNDPTHRLAFQNEGGLMSGGVCWWHSRMQRAAVYLTQFSPQKSRPSSKDAKDLVHRLAQMKEVIEIPGFRNFYEFSQANKSIIQSELNRWQIEDGFIRQQWLRGLYGRSSMPADALKRRMDTVFSKFVTHDPGLWAMAQIKGITSHSILIMDMQPVDQGYRVAYIDSNYPSETMTLNYHYGDESISEYKMVPYVGFNHDYDLIKGAIADHCGGKSHLAESRAPLASIDQE